MVKKISDRRDVDFVLHEQIGMVEHEAFDEFNKKTIDLIVSEARNLAMCDDPEVGGQGMPDLVGCAALEYMVGANSAFMLYYGMTHGAAKLVEAFGNENQKKLYMKKMFAGTWGGTMLLTEPEAGSDVGALTTTATKNEDGTYSIQGSKIFISAGEHDLCDNIIKVCLKCSG